MASDAVKAVADGQLRLIPDSHVVRISLLYVDNALIPFLGCVEQVARKL